MMVNSSSVSDKNAYDAPKTGVAARKLTGENRRTGKSIQSALFQGGHPRVLSLSALLLLSHGVE